MSPDWRVDTLCATAWFCTEIEAWDAVRALPCGSAYSVLHLDAWGEWTPIETDVTTESFEVVIDGDTPELGAAIAQATRRFPSQAGVHVGIRTDQDTGMRVVLSDAPTGDTRDQPLTVLLPAGDIDELAEWLGSLLRGVESLRAGSYVRDVAGRTGLVRRVGGTHATVLWFDGRYTVDAVETLTQAPDATGYVAAKARHDRTRRA